MKTIFLSVMVLFALNLNAQKPSTIAVDSICICLEAKVPETLNENLRDTLNACISHTAARKSEELMDEFKIKDGHTVEGIMEIMKRLHARLERKCDIYKEMIRN